MSIVKHMRRKPRLRNMRYKCAGSINIGGRHMAATVWPQRQIPLRGQLT